MNRRRITIILSIATIIIILAAIIIILHATSSKGEDITRYEWIKMLCEQTGMTEYDRSEPYFHDVERENTVWCIVRTEDGKVRV